jgi:hypothetical protein
VTVRAALAIGIVLAAAASARAQTAAEAELATIREEVLYASYVDAITHARALLDRTSLSAAERNDTLELLATAQIATQEADSARATLAQLFARDPGFRLTDADASPPVVSAFARARESHPPPVTVTLAHTSPGTLARRESPTITVRVTAGADAIDEVRLAYRHGAEGGFSRVVLDRRADGSFTGRIPVVGEADSAIDVAYYLSAVAPSGTEIGRLGSATEPLALRIPREAAPATAAPVVAEAPPVDQGGGDVASEPWFWIVIGAVAIGAGIGIGFGVDAASRGPEPGTLGVVTLMH